MENNLDLQNGYYVGHPWYYVLGGEVLLPKQIVALVKADEYRGYMAGDIESVNKWAEPKRTAALRLIKNKVVTDLQSDFSRYRKLACQLRIYRNENGSPARNLICEDIHTNISLKFAHIYNGLSHIDFLGQLPLQRDLFDF